MSKQQTVAERKHVARVIRLGCICCRNNGLDTADVACEFHHLRVGNQGVALRSSWYRGLGLCVPHHRQADGSERFAGEIGYHISPEEFELRYGAQEDLLKQTLRELGLNPQEAKYQARMLAEELVG